MATPGGVVAKRRILAWPVALSRPRLEPRRACAYNARFTEFLHPNLHPNGRSTPAHFFCLIANCVIKTRTAFSETLLTTLATNDKRSPSPRRAGVRAAPAAPSRRRGEGGGQGGRGRSGDQARAGGRPGAAAAASQLTRAGAAVDWTVGGGWQAAIERSVEGLGYGLVELGREGRGLLRVTIERLPGRAYPDGGDAVTVDDCEAVTRQLQYVLEVEGCDYARLEVSSPGLDRPLRRAADYARFVGCEVELTLREPLQGRRRFRGTLGVAADAGGADAAPGAPAAQADGERWRLLLPGGEQALDFALPEVREARLVPVLDFKGRQRGAVVPAAAPGSDGGREE
jgi:ribosome maturation factor RimP